MGSERLARVLCQLLLLLGKWYWRRRWRCLRHYGTAGCCCRWLRHPIGRRCCSTEQTISSWSHRSSRNHRCRGNLFCVHGDGCSGYRLGTPKGILRDGSHCAGYGLVDVCNVRTVVTIDVGDLIVVDVGDGRITHIGIAGVDAIHVPTACVIARHINFPRTQRKPTHIAAAVTTSAHRNRHSKVRSANEGY